jgi:hypothetical protein
MRGLTKWYPQLKELTPNQCNVDRSVNIRGKKKSIIQIELFLEYDTLGNVTIHPTLRIRYNFKYSKNMIPP